MKQLKVWPHLTIFAILIAIGAGAAVALWVKHRQNNNAATVLSAARIERVEGQVGINNTAATASQNATEDEWAVATENAPISAGDRIYTRDNSRASIAFSSRNFARLNDGSALDLLTLSSDRTQLALRDGSALFDVGYLAPGELFEVATPYGAVDFNQPGLYEVGIDDNGSAWVSVLNGLAQVVGLAGSGQVNKGEMLRLVGQTAAEVALSRIDPGYAGGLLNDYYGDRYPDYYDGRYGDYNAYLADPYYYDPSRRYTSYQYVNDRIPGLYDLDGYGDWQSMNDYGYVWRPRVDGGWAPYQSGYWMNDYPHGMTWISTEPWGYAPYHYGRWANINGQWFWVPESSGTYPAYSPALVAFVPLSQTNEVGWVPLAPGEVYVPRYYDENWNARYWGDEDRFRQALNMNVPGAISFVPWDTFNHEIDRHHIRHYGRDRWASVQPILDPLSNGPLRNAVLRSAWGRGKIDLPPGIAKKLDDRKFIVGREIPREFRSRLARRGQIEEVPETARHQKFKVRDDRALKSETKFARKEEKLNASARGERVVNRGNAEREVIQLRQEQRAVAEQNRQRRVQRSAPGQMRQRGNEQQFRVNAKPEPRKPVEFKGPPVRATGNKGGRGVEIPKQPKQNGAGQVEQKPQRQNKGVQRQAEQGPAKGGVEQKAQGGGKGKGKGRG